MVILKLKQCFQVLGFFIASIALGAVSEKKLDDTSTKNTVVVGILAPLSGPLKEVGDEFIRGIDLALEELKTREGPRVELKVVDDKGRGEDSANAVRKLILESRVQVLLGPLTEDALVLDSAIIENLRVPLLSPTPHLAPQLSYSPYLFLVNPSLDLLALRMAAFLKTQKRSGALGLLVDQSSQSSLRQAEVFRAALGDAASVAQNTATYSLGNNDFSAQIASFQKAGVDTVYMPGQAKDAAAFMTQIYGMGLRWLVLGSPDWNSAELYVGKSPATIGHYFPLSYFSEIPSVKNKAFVESFSQLHKRSPSAIAAWGYDSLNYVIEAANHSKIPGSVVALKDSLHDLKAFEGVSGVFEINKKGINQKDVFLMETQSERSRLHGPL